MYETLLDAQRSVLDTLGLSEGISHTFGDTFYLKTFHNPAEEKLFVGTQGSVRHSPSQPTRGPHSSQVISEVDDLIWDAACKISRFGNRQFTSLGLESM